MNRATLNYSLLNTSALNASRLNAEGIARRKDTGHADLTADLLTEQGTFLLTETGGKMLLETNTH